MSNENPMRVESALIEHLSNSIASVQEVGSFETYQWYIDNNDMPPLPSLYVMPTDDTDIAESGEGFDTESQMYLVSIVVSHVPSKDYANSSAVQAGAIMAEIATALINWRPEYQGSRLAGFNSFRYKGRSSPNYAPGLAEFPVLYETTQTLTGS